MPAALGPCSRLGIQSAQGIRRGSCAAFTPAAFTHRYDSFRSQRAGRVRRGCRITGIAAVRPGRASPNRTPSVRLSPMQTASARTCMQPAPALSMNGAVPYCRYRRRTDMRSSATDTPAARGHELSEGRYIGMGWLDRRDLMRWISLIVQADPPREDSAARRVDGRHRSDDDYRATCARRSRIAVPRQCGISSPTTRCRCITCRSGGWRCPRWPA